MYTYNPFEWIRLEEAETPRIIVVNTQEKNEVVFRLNSKVRERILEAADSPDYLQIHYGLHNLYWVVAETVKTRKDKTTFDRKSVLEELEKEKQGGWIRVGGVVFVRELLDNMTDEQFRQFLLIYDNFFDHGLRGYARTIYKQMEKLHDLNPSTVPNEWELVVNINSRKIPISPR